MAASAALRNPVDQQEPTPSRDEVLARYRHLREISKQHNDAILKLISWEAMLRQARSLGVATGRTIIVDRMEDLYLAYDLSIYTAPAPERSIVMPDRPGLHRAPTKRSCLKLCVTPALRS